MFFLLLTLLAMSDGVKATDIDFTPQGRLQSNIDGHLSRGPMSTAYDVDTAESELYIVNGQPDRQGIAFTVGGVSTQVFVGLTRMDAAPLTSTTYAMYLSNAGTVEVWEKGSRVQADGYAYTADTRFSIRVSSLGGAVEYFLDGHRIWKSTVPTEGNAFRMFVNVGTGSQDFVLTSATWVPKDQCLSSEEECASLFREVCFISQCGDCFAGAATHDIVSI